jgi:hypothetical protein
VQHRFSCVGAVPARRCRPPFLPINPQKPQQAASTHVRINTFFAKQVLHQPFINRSKAKSGRQ